MDQPQDPTAARTPLHISILTLFPELFDHALNISIPGRAKEAGLATYTPVNIRDFADNKHNKVDDRPFGGGPGMVMMCEPLHAAVNHAEHAHFTPPRRVYLTPQGTPLNQQLVQQLASEPGLLLICGHYEGIDERVIEHLNPLEISVGDYVLSGGEFPALTLIDAVVRLLPGVLGHADSAASDSFQPSGPDGTPLLDCPHYTRPRVWEGREVPDVLLSGDHGRVDQWRLQQMLERTRVRRPDLLPDQ